MGRSSVALSKPYFPDLVVHLLRCTPLAAQVTSGPHCVTLWDLGLWEPAHHIALAADFFVINKQSLSVIQRVCVPLAYVHKYVAGFIVSLQVG